MFSFSKELDFLELAKYSKFWCFLLKQNTETHISIVTLGTKHYEVGELKSQTKKSIVLTFIMIENANLKMVK